MFATVVSEISFANLTPASGRQDHTTSPSARNVIRLLTLPRPSHPLPNVRDDRETPLCVGRDGEDKQVIWVRSEPEYFCKEGWTGVSVICPSGGNAREIIPGFSIRLQTT